MSAASAAPPITIDGVRASVRFDRFDLAAYELFIRCKALPESELVFDPDTDTYTLTTPARFAERLGLVTAAPLAPRADLAPHLFDYQRFVVGRALDAQRYAIWLDTGLGKTAVFLEWARQVLAMTGGRVLIVERDLQVIRQVVAEAARWYGDALPVTVLRSRAALVAWCQQPGGGLAITNYEQFVPGLLPELRYLAGLVADESSILRTGGGVIKWNLIKSARGIPYKLSATATPAPNEVMEYASQAAFLEKLRTEQDILWTFFSRDKYGTWSVKPHAHAAFYRFMASWSIYMRDPARFGFADILADLPDPAIHEHRLPISPIQREMMLAFLTRAKKGMFADRLGVQERSKLSQLAKGFLYDQAASGQRRVARYESAKPAFVADLVRQEIAAGRQVLVWTVFDAESTILAEQLADVSGVLTLHGEMSEPARSAALDAFRSGAPVLISKAALIGYGLNLQFCRSMVFSGFDDSMERMYQAIRRSLRFGQTETVHVHIPYIPELEGMIFENVRGKERQFFDAVAACEAAYRAAMQEETRA